MAFARFNLGVALVSQNRVGEAAQQLSAVGTMHAVGTEMQTLRDKANLALGYAWLQAGNPKEAKTALDRVRLIGPYATRALLGVGWADAALGQYKDALTPWTELHGRNILDAAVQESYLAVPYAYAKLNANAQAADYYESAIKSFQDESGTIDNAVTHINSGHMLDDLLGATPPSQDIGWFWQLKQLPDVPESRYLYALLADNDFQEGLKNYRDLGFLRGKLDSWNDNLEAYHDMIDTRRQADAERLPRADALLATNATSGMLAERAAVDTRLTTIETGADVAALGNSKEQAEWAKIRQLEAAATDTGNPAYAQMSGERDKIKLMKGVLFWQFDAQFKERSYLQRRELRALDAQLNEAQNRWVRVQKARGSVPTNTEEFATRISKLAARISELREQLTKSAQDQQHYLEQLASQALLEQKERLTEYEVQAHFALADIYDRSSEPPPSPAREAAPEDEPAPDAAAPDAPAPDTAPQ
jgi:hypothetical protein